MKPGFTAPMKAFAAGGALLIMCALLTGYFAPGGHYRAPHWFRKFELPMVGVSAALCVLAPVLSQAPWRRRIWLFGLSTVGFGILLIATVVLSLIVFGLPDQD